MLPYEQIVKYFIQTMFLSE